MDTKVSPNQIDLLLTTLDRIAVALEQFSLAPNQACIDLPPALAYRWQRSDNTLLRPQLTPVVSPQLIAFEALHNVDQQITRIYNNTMQFVQGYPANNVLMTGARGTGKSSLVRACLQAFQTQGLRLIEVEKKHLDDLPDIVNCVRNRPERFIIFCDDLSFEEGEHHYKGLKTVLDGSVAGPSENVLIYATSNRRHLVSERMRDNLEHYKDDQGEIHPGDSIEEKNSLSERFGLRIHFYSFSQDEYLTAVFHWLSNLGLTLNNDEIRTEALRWATERGSRSGRVAWQFARDYVGRTAIQSKGMLKK